MSFENYNFSLAVKGKGKNNIYPINMFEFGYSGDKSGKATYESLNEYISSFSLPELYKLLEYAIPFEYKNMPFTICYNDGKEIRELPVVTKETKKHTDPMEIMSFLKSNIGNQNILNNDLYNYLNKFINQHQHEYPFSPGFIDLVTSLNKLTETDIRNLLFVDDSLELNVLGMRIYDNYIKNQDLDNLVDEDRTLQKNPKPLKTQNTRPVILINPVAYEILSQQEQKKESNEIDPKMLALILEQQRNQRK